MMQKSSLILDSWQHMYFLFKLYSLLPFPDVEANLDRGVAVTPIAHSIPESCMFFLLL